MKSKQYDILLVMLILTVITVVFILYRLLTLHPPNYSLDFKSIKNKLKTGDLLLVPYDSIYGSLVKIFRGCYWTHTSLVYKKDDKIYVIEVARYDPEDEDKIYKGLIMIPLEKWLKFNRGRKIGYCKYVGNKKPQHEEVEKIFNKFKHIKANLNTIYWMNTLVTWDYYYEDRKKYFCTEFVAKMLQDLRMIRTKYLPCNYSPITFSELPEYKNKILILSN